MDHDADLAEHLNDAGLLSDLSYAERLMEKANETGYGEGLFACIRILAQVMYSSDVTVVEILVERCPRCWAPTPVAGEPTL